MANLPNIYYNVTGYIQQTGDEPMPKATIRDVARLANVSTATVSRVINHAEKVSDGTRQTVLEACAKLNYSPHPIARRLSLGRTHMIGVILPYLTLPSIVERLRGIQHALEDTDYDLVPFSVGTPEKREERLRELSSTSRIDGLLIVSVPPTSRQVDRLLDHDVPTVLLDAHHPELNCLIVDDVRGGYLATKHLIDLGHRKIAHIRDYPQNPMGFSSVAKRYQGYLQALQEADLRVRPDYLKEGTHGREEARRMAREVLQLPDPPTAIFAYSDTQAIGVLDAARELDIPIPEALSVIGYDGIRDAEYLDLTTIAQPLLESGIMAANTLLALQDSPLESPLQITLPIRLIDRGTTGPPP